MRPSATGISCQRVDGHTPNVARMHNYLLDGKDNFAADRSAVWGLLEQAPELYTIARAERLFLMRNVRWLAEKAGIDQFLDLGCGMPLGRSVHERAAGFGGRPRVVYVDNDPVVVAHGRALLDGPNVVTVPGDVRDPKRLLGDPKLGSVIDFDRPVAVLCSALLYHLDDDEHVRGLMGAFRDVLVPGSALLVTHLCGDGADPRVIDAVEEVYTGANAPLTLRSRDQITRLFDGFDLEAPGVTDVAHWPSLRPPTGRKAITSCGGVALRSRA